MKAFITLATLALTGCILDHDPKVIHREYQVDPECLREDSTTWTDTSEVKHISCTIDPRGEK